MIDSTTLVVRRTIAASSEFLFDAWTSPKVLMQWWGPKDVTCPAAEIDLRVGGRYRIANRFPDGKVVWIAGQFESIDRPHKIIFTWQIEPQSTFERVTVKFEPRDQRTEVIVMHELVEDSTRRRSHEVGWEGCLDGLAELAALTGALRPQSP